MKKVLAILFVLVMAVSLMAGCGEDTTTTTAADVTTTTTTAAATTTTTTAAATTTTASNAKTYDDILAEAGIVRMANIPGYEVASFVGVVSGMIDCQDYGYKNDIVEVIVETMYVSVEGYSDDQKTTLDSSMRAAFAAYEALDFMTVEYEMGARYYKIVMTSTDLDDSDNVHALYDAGLITDDVDLISVSQSEAAFIAMGYVKK